MSTVTAILEPDADGSLHLPLPKELRRGKLKVTATLEPAETQPDEAEAKMEAALAALGRLRELGTFREITDRVAWQREIRTDRPLSGRERCHSAGE